MFSTDIDIISDLSAEESNPGSLRNNKNRPKFHWLSSLSPMFTLWPRELIFLTFCLCVSTLRLLNAYWSSCSLIYEHVLMQRANLGRIIGNNKIIILAMEGLKKIMLNFRNSLLFSFKWPYSINYVSITAYGIYKSIFIFKLTLGSSQRSSNYKKPSLPTRMFTKHKQAMVLSPDLSWTMTSGEVGIRPGISPHIHSPSAWSSSPDPSHDAHSTRHFPLLLCTCTFPF